MTSEASETGSPVTENNQNPHILRKEVYTGHFNLEYAVIAGVSATSLGHSDQFGWPGAPVAPCCIVCAATAASTIRAAQHTIWTL